MNRQGIKELNIEKKRLREKPVPVTQHTHHEVASDVPSIRVCSSDFQFFIWTFKITGNRIRELQ